MSTAVQQFHEEEALQKFDRGGARRLLRYLKPYKRLILPALVFTLLADVEVVHDAWPTPLVIVK